MKLRKLCVAIAKVTMLGSLIAGSMANAELVEYHSPDYSLGEKEQKNKVRISANGRYIAYSDDVIFDEIYNEDQSKSWGLRKVTLLDRKTGIKVFERDLVSACWVRECPQQWDMSRDGKYFVFESALSIHVEEDTDERNDIFLLEIASGEISLISKDIGHANYLRSYYAPTISSTGKYITYYVANEYNFRPSNDGVKATYVFNVETGETTELDSSDKGRLAAKSSLDISADGKYVLSDHSHGGEFSLTNTEEQSETLLPYPVHADSNSKLSADGRFVLFHQGYHSNFWPLHIYDTKTAQTTVLSVATDGSNSPTRISMGNFAVSGDGRYITFVSKDDGLVEGDVDGVADVFVYDRVAHQTATVNEGQFFNTYAVARNSLDISEDGHYIVFNNYVATNPFFISSQYCEGYEEF